MLGERAVHGQPTAHLGTVKNSLGLLDWTEKRPFFICMKLLQLNGLELCKRNANAWNLMC